MISAAVKEFGTAVEADAAPVEQVAQTKEAPKSPAVPEKILLRHIRSARWIKASEEWANLLKTPLILEAQFPAIQRAFSEVEQEDLLWAWLLEAASVVSGRLLLMAKLVEIGVKLGRDAEAMRNFRKLRRRRSEPFIRFSNFDQVSRYEFLGTYVKNQLLALKYKSISMARREDIFEAAEQLSDRMDIDPNLLAVLSTHRRETAMPRAEWEKQIRIASCLDHIMSDQPRLAGMKGKRIGSLPELLDEEAMAEMFKTVDLDKGLLLATFHGGFIGFAKSIFRKVFPEGLHLESGVTPGFDPSDTRRVGVKADPQAALFIALRALQRRNAVMIAADAKVGTRTSVLDVIGQPVSFADGAAFLAYESGCASFWYTARRKGRMFVPVLVPAPKPLPRERFEAFKARWLAFYGAQLNAHLTGDPSNIILRSRWRELV